MTSLATWKKWESASKTVSALAIPIVIAIGGWLIQQSISTQSVNKDYVTLALSILEKPKSQVDPSIRAWAVDLLNKASPLSLPASAIVSLKAGSVNLSALAPVVKSSEPIVAISPDGKTFVRSQGALVGAVDDAAHLVLWIEDVRVGEIFCLQYSRDGKTIFVAGSDQIIRQLDAKNGAFQRTFYTRGPVRGLGFNFDSSLLFVKLQDGGIDSLNTTTGTLTTMTNK